MLKRYKARLDALEALEASAPVRPRLLTERERYAAWRARQKGGPSEPLWSQFSDDEIAMLLRTLDTDPLLCAPEQRDVEVRYRDLVREELAEAIEAVERRRINIHSSGGRPEPIAMFADLALSARAARMRTWVPDCARRLGRAVPRTAPELRALLDAMQAEYTAEGTRP